MPKKISAPVQVQAVDNGIYHYADAYENLFEAEMEIIFIDAPDQDVYEDNLFTDTAMPEIVFNAPDQDVYEDNFINDMDDDVEGAVSNRDDYVNVDNSPKVGAKRRKGKHPKVEYLHNGGLAAFV